MATGLPKKLRPPTYIVFLEPIRIRIQVFLLRQLDLPAVVVQYLNERYRHSPSNNSPISGRPFPSCSHLGHELVSQRTAYSSSLANSNINRWPFISSLTPPILRASSLAHQGALLIFANRYLYASFTLRDLLIYCCMIRYGVSVTWSARLIAAL